MNKKGQLGFIAYLASKVGPHGKLGRKAFQKLVHIATDFAGIPTGYNFSFYTYGPYSRELASDLELAVQVGAIVSSQKDSGVGFDIRGGVDSEAYVKASMSQWEEFKSTLDQVAEKFGNQTANVLELYSTIVFVERELDQPFEKDALVSQVSKLKPKYLTSEIESSYEELLAFGRKVVGGSE